MSIIKKRYTKAEKLSIVNESISDHIELSDLAVRYSVHANTIGRWRREFAVYQEAAFPGNGNAILTEEQKENQRLRKQLREAELANEILKKALGIISSPSGKNFLL